jgi:hypothetical protein
VEKSGIDMKLPGGICVVYGQARGFRMKMQNRIVTAEGSDTTGAEYRSSSWSPNKKYLHLTPLKSTMLHSPLKINEAS